MHDKIFLTELVIPCKIGIFDWERKIKQKISLDLEIPADIQKAARHDRIKDAVDYKKIAKYAIDFVGRSEFYLIEKIGRAHV